MKSSILLFRVQNNEVLLCEHQISFSANWAVLQEVFNVNNQSVHRAVDSHRNALTMRDNLTVHRVLIDIPIVSKYRSH